MSERYKESLSFFEEAKNYSKAGDQCKAVISYIKTFWLRSVDEGFFDIEYASFFRYQFASYLRGKKRVALSLSEGDMIADLIRDVYEEMRARMDDSPFCVSAENEWNILKQVRITFPHSGDPDLAV